MNQINQQLIASKISDLASTTNEKALEKEVSRFFKRIRKEVLNALEEYWNDNSMFQGQIDLILAPIHTGLKEYYEIILARKVQEYQRGSKAASRIVQRVTDNVAMKAAKPVTFTPTKDNLFGTLNQAENRLSNYTFTASESTMNRVDQSIKQILTDGYTDGVGINEVSNRVSERFGQLESWESKRIARTEIHNAQNIGIMDTYQDLGVEYTMWSAAGDDRTRDSHVELDGEIIPMGGTYSNGLSYPGDTSGPIEEWINCRCANAPFVMPAGMMAPPGVEQFREGDLVPLPEQPSVVEPVTTEPEPIETDTTQTKIEELEKQIQENQVLADKWRSKGNDSIAQTFQEEADSLQIELNKLKKPKVKVVADPVMPKSEIDNIIDDVLGDLKLKDKKKPKSKPKQKEELKATTPTQEVTTRTVTEQLKSELPSDFNNKAINYIADRVKKRGTVKSEYGQIFDYKTGKTHSPEFKGGNHSVNIKTEDWKKPVKQMTTKEQMDALSNPQKYKESYIDKSNTLATQHNHPQDGTHAPSGADFYGVLTNKWEDYGLQISKNEVWCIEKKGTISMFDAKDIEKKCDKLFSKAKRAATKRLGKEFTELKGQDRISKHMELTNEEYSNELLKYFKNQPHGIKLTQVKV